MEKEIELVYLGTEVWFSGTPKKFQAYIQPEKVEGYLNSNPTVHALVFKKQLVRVAVGAVIKCQAEVEDDGHIIVHGKPQFVRLLDFQTRLQLEAKSESSKVLFEQETLRRKGEMDSALVDEVAKIKTAYNKLPNSRRKAFIAWLLVELG